MSRLLFTAATLLLLVSCGGGGYGGDSSPPPPPPPAPSAAELLAEELQGLTLEDFYFESFGALLERTPEDIVTYDPGSEIVTVRFARCSYVLSSRGSTAVRCHRQDAVNRFAADLVVPMYERFYEEILSAPVAPGVDT